MRSSVMLIFRALPAALLCMFLSSPTLAAQVFASPGTVADSARSFRCSDSASRTQVMVVDTALAGVPATLRIPESVSKPPIVLWHGFGPPDSERALMEALPLDDVPAIKVYLGLPLFGARMPAEGMREVVRRQNEDMATLVFEPVVVGAATELSAVVEALHAQECIRAGDAIGLFGFSAGGAAVLLALAERDVPISTAVTLNASTGLSASVDAYERALKRSYSWTPPARELAKRSDAAGRAADIARGNTPPALLIIHGEDDAMMSSQIAVSLHASLLPFYEKTNNGARARLEVTPGMTHAWTDAGSIEKMRSLISDWYRRYL
jgi:dienelactone hydrolase